MPTKVRPRTSPLLLREGARYRCFGDGLCCNDIHGLGPLTRAELYQIRKIDPRGAAYADDFEDYMLETAADGGCHFLRPDQLCGIHAERGPEAKPDGCRQFPYRLGGTPMGMRIGTKHRCPCRTMGDRPPLDLDDAVASLTDSKGKLDTTHDVDRVRLAPRRFVTVEQYAAIEAPLLARLATGEDALEVLRAKPFPKLKGESFAIVGKEFIKERDGSRFGAALGWFGDTILHLVDGRPARPPGRPWADAFDRAEARSPIPADPAIVLNDWVADELWNLEWATVSSFQQVRLELATRVAVVRSIASRLGALGIRPDRAVAEALTVVDSVGSSEHWERVVERMIPPPGVDPFLPQPSRSKRSAREARA
jgi:Fe-S-cluster containining protein